MSEAFDGTAGLKSLRREMAAIRALRSSHHARRNPVTRWIAETFHNKDKIETFCDDAVDAVAGVIIAFYSQPVNIRPETVSRLEAFDQRLRLAFGAATVGEADKIEASRIEAALLKTKEIAQAAS